MTYIISGVGPAFLQDIGQSIAKNIVSALPIVASMNKWVYAILAIITTIILSQIITQVITSVVKKIVSKTKTQIDDIIIEYTEQPAAWLLFSVLIYIALAPVDFGSANTLVSGILSSINIILLALLIHKLISAVFKVWTDIFAKKTRNTIDDTILPILSKFIKATLWILAFIGILSTWGFEVTPFLAGLGIAGMAIGLAVKDSLANVFAGVTLAFDNAYKIGDKIKFADGTVGIVHDITLRSTRIKTYDGDLVMVPNAKIANDNIYTYAQPKRASRVQIDFGVEYGSDVKKVKEVVLQAIKSIEGIKEDPEPTVLFMEMGASALEMRAYFWVPDYEQAFSKKREAVELIYNTLQKKKIGIPFPTMTVYLKK